MTVAQTIINGWLSAGICANYNARGSLFGGALAAPKSSVTIQMVSDVLNWGYVGGAQTQADLITVSNYLIWLCGSFGLQAQQITGTGGSVIPISPVSSAPDRVDFYVTSSSYLVTGTTSATLTSFIGYNLDFIRNGLPQSTLSTEPSYFTFSRTTGAFTCSPALTAGELIALIPAA